MNFVLAQGPHDLKITFETFDRLLRQQTQLHECGNDCPKSVGQALPGFRNPKQMPKARSLVAQMLTSFTRMQGYLVGLLYLLQLARLGWPGDAGHSYRNPSVDDIQIPCRYLDSLWLSSHTAPRLPLNVHPTTSRPTMHRPCNTQLLP